ncbi:MAG: nitroreductase [Acidimicrobiales bacterium]
MTELLADEAMVERLRAPRSEPDRNGTAPDDADLTAILEVATTVPDHGSLRPWRFAVVRGPARDRFGDALVAGLHEQRGSDLPDAVVAKMHQKAFAAPACVALIASPDVGANVPVWEQEASAACTGYAIVLAAQALGYGAIWKSAATVDAPAVRAFFALSEHERLLGWVNLGTPTPPKAQRRTAAEGPALVDIVTVFDDTDARPFDPGAAG